MQNIRELELETIERIREAFHQFPEYYILKMYNYISVNT